ncbi:serine/threonine-protein kinase [Streptomyces tropicalis]|uniref:Serine/threonine-protein kinase n=1 Tax=Streptomyces tropicalis TaxID=3034234 RepID=A0ABT6AED4_9ACTN|nr:serine/threonine-protein kinase [Streptomyces tropicalis]MDF3303001.1 serine/threonine-protein kinase [Streptomyces tropicalis]
MTPQRNGGAGAAADRPEYAGQYRLQSRLGSGGMGVVHLARSTSGLTLAVKVVHTSHAADPEFRGRFRQEVAAARRVSGAFTAPVVDADPEAERPWMATLFIPGPTLAEQVKRNGPMAPPQLRRLMAGLAEALRDIHRVGVVHRDLKPSNVLLAEDGPKVIDFGISRPMDSELRTETGKLIGTPPFMAPEQFRRPREVGPAADIFALGSVLVHAATGRGPFDSDSPYIVAYQVVHDEPDLTGVPDNLAPLVLRCLAKEPGDRPTPDELMRELRRVAASYDTQAFIPGQRSQDAPRPEQAGPADAVDSAAESTAGSTGERPPGRGRFRPTAPVLALAAGGLALVAGAVFGSVRLLGDQDRPAPHASAPRTASAAFSGWAAKSWSDEGGTPQCSYGAGALVCARPGLLYALDPASGRKLWRHPLGERQLRTAPPAVAGGLVQPMTDHGRELEALDPATGRPRWHRSVPAYSGVLEAGGRLLLTGVDGVVRAVDGASGGIRWSRRVPGVALPHFFSFAGDPLAYTASTSDDGSATRVLAVDPRTGGVRWEARLRGTLTPVGSEGGSLVLLSARADFIGQVDAVVRYTPASRTARRIALPLPRDTAQATVHGGVVHLLAEGGSLEAVDLATGRERWRLETAVSRGSAPAADDRHVYVTAGDGRLLAVDARTGRLLGQTVPRFGPHPDRVAASLPAPLPVGDHVYAAAPDGTVFAEDGRAPSHW